MRGLIMTTSPAASPDPIHLEGGPIGVLLVHGFTGSPAEIRPVAGWLNQAGYTVLAPCLIGHGTSPPDLNRVRWQQWVDQVESAYVELKSHCQLVFAGGLSLGSLLSLYLGARQPAILGLLLYSPPLVVWDRRAYLIPLIKYTVSVAMKSGDDFVDSRAKEKIWNYPGFPLKAAHQGLKFQKEVRRCLPQVSCPLLVIHSMRDPVVPKQSISLIKERAGSTEMEFIELRNCGHVITLDAEWETVAHSSHRFMEKLLPESLRRN
jgi:carboxylesterase